MKDEPTFMQRMILMVAFYIIYAYVEVKNFIDSLFSSD